MTADDAELSEPTLRAEDVLVLEDPRFGLETVAVVTGAASGIGRATAVALAMNGLTVVGADVDEAGLDDTVSRARDLDAPGAVVRMPTDLRDDDDVRALVETATAEGDLRYVANVAGTQHVAPLSEFPMEEYDRILDVMLRAPFLLSKLSLPHIRAADGGAIANMSSVHGHYATRDKAAYITAKHGLHGLTRAVAAEGEGTVRSFSVSVGYVLTPLMLEQIADAARERDVSEREVVEDVMLGPARTDEMMTPVEVANLFTFGFSSHGSHLNGSDMLWDGGYTGTYE
jgi:3-hydroxybutyrate dehydrogenase